MHVISMNMSETEFFRLFKNEYLQMVANSECHVVGKGLLHCGHQFIDYETNVGYVDLFYLFVEDSIVRTYHSSVDYMDKQQISNLLPTKEIKWNAYSTDDQIVNVSVPNKPPVILKAHYGSTYLQSYCKASTCSHNYEKGRMDKKRMEVYFLWYICYCIAIYFVMFLILCYVYKFSVLEDYINRMDRIITVMLSYVNW